MPACAVHKPGNSKSEAAREADEREGLMTVKEACGLLAVSHDTISRRIRAGELRAWKDPVSGALRLYRRSVLDYLRRGEM